MADHADDANLPPVPEHRTITPAPEDYANPPAIANLLWPVVWVGVAFVLWTAASALGWVEWVGH